MRIEIQIYSPRWGHDDTYTLEFEENRFVFTQAGPRPPAIATYVEGGDPTWENREGVFDMLHNDTIYPPKIIPDALEYLWLEWKNRGMSEAEVQQEANAIAEYINACSRAQPNTRFWNGYM